MPRLLKDLQIFDVSSVDRGAGEGVKVLLLKRQRESDEMTQLEKVQKANDEFEKLIDEHVKKFPKISRAKATRELMATPAGRSAYQKEKEARLGPGY